MAAGHAFYHPCVIPFSISRGSKMAAWLEFQFLLKSSHCLVNAYLVVGTTLHVLCELVNYNSPVTQLLLLLFYRSQHRTAEVSHPGMHS